MTRASSTSAKSWRDDLKIHPACEAFRLLSETDPAALRALGEDIKKNGLTLPIVLWSDGKSSAVLLDGRNRLDAIEVAIGGPVIVGPPSLMAGKDFLACDKVIVLDRSIDPFDYVASANEHRRHSSPAERIESAEKLAKANPTMSARRIAKLANISPTTAVKAKTKVREAGDVSTV